MALEFFDGNGYKLPDEVEDELENMFVKVQIMNWRLQVMVLVKLSSIVTAAHLYAILYVTQSIRPLKG